MTPLHTLQARPGDPIRADHWNRLLEELARRIPRGGTAEIEDNGFDAHPWRVSVSRWEEAPGTTFAGEKLDPKRTWRVRFRPGFVNDQEATFVYRTKNDPRGWKADPQFAKGLFLDRLMTESADSPFSFVVAPPQGQLENRWFVDFSDIRPQYFRTAERINRPLLKSYALLSTTPAQTFADPQLVAGPNRFRVGTGKRPPVTGPANGAWIVLAALWLLRGETVEEDQLFVQQQIFANLMTTSVQPDSFLPDTSRPDDPLSAILFDLVKDQVDAALADSAGTVFWIC